MRKAVISCVISILLLLLVLLALGCQMKREVAPTPPISTQPPTAPTTEPEQEPTVSPNSSTTTKELKVHFIDVGHGDAILIDLGETEILIDGGLPMSGVATYLKDYIDGSLEVMVATHPHPDHIGGLMEVLDTFDVDEIWLNGDSLRSNIPRNTPLYKSFQQFMGLVNAEGASIREVRRGQSIDVDVLTFHVLHPVLPLLEASSAATNVVLRSGNNNSIVLRLSYGNIDFLFTGDVSKEVEASILEAGLTVQADILKVGHHGSRGSSSHQLLNAVMPKIAIYMTGEGATILDYGHPDTIAALNKVGAKVYGTDINGTIVITTDGEKYTVHTEK